MSIKIVKRKSNDGKKIYYDLVKHRFVGGRKTLGIFTYATPADLIEKNFNKEQFEILKQLEAQEILENQNNPDGYIPNHKIKQNFLDYYKQYVTDNPSGTNRSLPSSLIAFKTFMENRQFISPREITKELCRKFRNYLLQKYNGETPSGYFSRFKQLLDKMTDERYYKISPAIKISAKSNPSKPKDILDVAEWEALMKANFYNYEIKKAAVCSLYSALRWCDVKSLTWDQINLKQNTWSKCQQKTKVHLSVPLHPIVREIIGEPGVGLVFKLPSSTAANNALNEWAVNAGLGKHITWHCFRHSFSVLLQNEGVDDATVAGLLGHKSKEHVQKTYQRYQQPMAQKAIMKLPNRVQQGQPSDEKLGLRLQFIRELKDLGFSPDEIKSELKKLL